jgi:hypothetical protein
MGSIGFLFTPWGLILQALAIIHFIRRRPDTYWLFIIIFLGPLGALVYIVIEVIPDLGLLRHTFDAFPRRNRIRHLEALVLDNPAVGNYEELGDLYLEERKWARAKECYDKALSSRADLADVFYRRAIAEIELGEFAAAVQDLEHVISRDPKYDSHRAAGLLAHAYAHTGEAERADAIFQQVTQKSTLSEIYYNYADFLASQQRTVEAQEWAQRILAKKPTMPGYLRRRERPWFRKANALLKRLPANGAAGALHKSESA